MRFLWSCIVLLALAVLPSWQATLRSKRAINPFLDSMGKRAMNPFLDSIGKRSAQPYYPHGIPAKRYFDSLAGQSLGKRSFVVLPTDLQQY